MKKLNLLILSLAILAMSACGQIKNIMDGTEHLPDQIAETNRGMAKTNESIRHQTIEISLAGMKKKENRITLSPVPVDMMTYGPSMAETLTVDEALKFCEAYITKINKETLGDRNADLTPDSPDYMSTLKEFEHDKMADLQMVTIVAGNLPDATVQAMINQEAEQGAYRKTLYQILMLRSNFNSDVMLKAKTLEYKLETIGSINLAIQYNQKVDFIDKLPFADKVGLKITGFTTPEKNVNMKLDTALASTNWNQIYSSAQSDFKTTSYNTDPTAKSQSEAAQTAQFNQSLDVIKGYLSSWGATLTALQ